MQQRQAEKELKGTEEVLPRAARECYKWLLCPFQETPTVPKPSVESFPVNTTGGSVSGEIERVCKENELVIATWSPIHLRTKRKEIYWKDGQSATSAMGFFEDTLRYLYLPAPLPAPRPRQTTPHAHSAPPRWGYLAPVPPRRCLRGCPRGLATPFPAMLR